MTFKDGRILKSLSKEESPLLRWICYLDLIFFFSMLPLSPPPGYIKENHSIISKFIWNDKCPRIKCTTLQRTNSAGGLAVPIFNCIIGRSSLRLFIIGLILNLQFHGGWLKLTRLNQIDFRYFISDKIFYLLAQEKRDNYKFGPVVANSIKIWKTVWTSDRRTLQILYTVHLYGTILILYAEIVHFVQTSWSSLGVNTCGDIYDNQGLCSFRH